MSLRAKPSVPDATTTCELVLRVQDGDERAYERLVATFGPLLLRWAHGRVPSAARGAADTHDVVQDTLLSVHRRIGRLKVDRPGSFWLYLRRSLHNRLINTARDSARRPSADVQIEHADLAGDKTDEDGILAYERGLERLSEEQRAVVVLRLEFGFSHEEVATAMNWPSADAARMRANRAVQELAKFME